MFGYVLVLDLFINFSVVGEAVKQPQLSLADISAMEEIVSYQSPIDREPNTNFSGRAEIFSAVRTDRQCVDLELRQRADLPQQIKQPV